MDFQIERSDEHPAGTNSVTQFTQFFINIFEISTFSIRNQFLKF